MCDVRKELPFAGYSVVKELSILPRPARIASSGAALKRLVVLVLAWPTRTRVDRRERRIGGEYRARTGDLLVANQALSQLS